MKSGFGLELKRITGVFFFGRIESKGCRLSKRGKQGWGSRDRVFQSVVGGEKRSLARTVAVGGRKD